MKLLYFIAAFGIGWFFFDYVRYYSHPHINYYVDRAANTCFVSTKNGDLIQLTCNEYILTHSRTVGER